jgi:hypothetical protein
MENLAKHVIKLEANSFVYFPSLVVQKRTMSEWKHEENVQFLGDLRLIGSNSLGNESKSLAELVNREHVYGFGMAKGLVGELLILDSVPYLGVFEHNEYKVVKLKEMQIAFGMFARVPAWKEFDIPESVKNFKDLQNFLPEAAASVGIDVDKAPLPIRIQVSANFLRWFVVNGMGNLQPNPRESFFRQLIKGGLDDVSLEGFGVYTAHHHGVYTNLVSNMHVHFKTGNGPQFLGKVEDDAEIKYGSEFVGHLDDEIELKPGGKLFLPL